MKVDIEVLQTFVEVAGAGGISPAASRLSLSKSVVSRRLARLEDELGLQLLARTPRGAALTEAGLTFMHYASRACAEMDLAREAMHPAGELRGRLRIAAPLSLASTHFMPAIAEMARRYPLLNVHTCYSDQVVDLIGEGYDCAIRLGDLPDSTLVARRIGPIYRTVVASPAYVAEHGAPEGLEELHHHQALMQGTEAWHLMNGGIKVAVRPQGRFKADNCTALLTATLAGLGICCLPTGLVREHLDAGSLVPILCNYSLPPAGAYIVRPPGQRTIQKVHVLTELLIEYFNKAEAA